MQGGYLFDHAERWSITKRPNSRSSPGSCFRLSYGPFKLAIRPFVSATLWNLRAWILLCLLHIKHKVEACLVLND